MLSNLTMLCRMRKRRAYILTIGILLFCYLTTMPETITDFDSGEFAVIAAKGGIAHPPGYPLYSILLQLAFLLSPKTKLIQGLSILSIIETIIAAVLILQMLFRLTKNLGASVTSVLVSFTAWPVWRASTSIEPFALNLLGASLALDAFSRILEKPQNEKLRIPGIEFGLASSMVLVNHQTLIFVIMPITISLIISSPFLIRKKNFLVPVLLGLMIGLMSILYFYLTNETSSVSWGNWSLLQHLTRAEYGTLSLSKFGDKTSRTSAVYYFISQFPETLSYLFLAPIYLSFRFWRRLSDDQKRTLLMSSTVFLLSAPFFLILSNMDVDDPLGYGQALIMRFFALPGIIICVPLAIGLSVFTVPPDKLLKTKVTLVATIFSHILLQLSLSDRRHERIYNDYIHNTFWLLKPGDIVLTYSDASVFGLAYGQDILGLGPEVILMNINNLNREDKRVAYANRLGIQASQLPTKPSFIPNLFPEKRVFITFDTQELGGITNTKLRGYHYGSFFRLLPDNIKQPNFDEVLNLNKNLLEFMPYPPNLVQINEANGWEASILMKYGINKEEIKKNMRTEP